MTHTIRKGKHDCWQLPRLHFGKTNLKFKFIFGAGCWFPVRLTDDYDINKLAGLSFGAHHNHSVRCGWVPNEEKDKIDLFFYLYADGQRFTKLFFTVDRGTQYELHMSMSNGLLSFSLRKDGATLILDSVAYKLPSFKLGYLLFPYVGGNLPARTDTYIDVKFI